MTSALQARQALLAHPAQQEYWTARIQGWTEPVLLLRDHLRPAAGAPRTTTVPLAAATTAALDRLTSGDPVLVRTVAATALAALAARSTDRDDTVVLLPVPPGTPAPYDRTVPLAAHLGAGLPAKAVLGAVRASYLEAAGHLDVPVHHLLEEHDSRPTDFMVSVDGDLGPDDADRAGAPLLFTLHTGPEPRVELRFDPVLFTDETADRLLSAYRVLLETITTAPDTTTDDLRAPSAAELALLDGFNETDAEFPRDRLLHSFLEEGARLHGDRIAVTDGGGTTYARLNADANRLARTLRERGVGAGSIVGVCVPRSAEMLTAIYAVLKAGGAYLPIDPTLPDSRIRYLLDHSGTALVLATAETSAVLGDRPVLDVADPANLAADDSDLEPVTGPEDACYVIYTSGSTGRPKGVVVEHRAIVNRLWWMQRGYPSAPTTSSSTRRRSPSTCRCGRSSGGRWREPPSPRCPTAPSATRHASRTGSPRAAPPPCTSSRACCTRSWRTPRPPAPATASARCAGSSPAARRSPPPTWNCSTPRCRAPCWSTSTAPRRPPSTSAGTTATPSTPRAPYRSAGRSTTSASSSSPGTAGRPPWAPPASCASRGSVWPAATCTPPS
ncbi:AMP-binding protein [Streptomyces somaliensis DSM 40738]|nr:AMP-binding protein [Streptomyces somaliensis DSM 40738]